MTNSSKQVTIVATDRKYEEAPCFCAPYFDRRRQVFIIGKKEYKSEATRPDRGPVYHTSVGTPIVLTNNSDYDQIQLNAGMILDRDSPADMFRMEIYLASGYVAENKQAVNPDKHRFYLQDPLAEAESSSLLADRVFEALTFVKSLSASGKADVAFYLKQPVMSMSEVQVESYLKGLATNRPNDILQVEQKDKRLFAVLAFIQKLVQAGILQNEGGQYKYGDDLIGIDETATCRYMMMPSNNAKVKQFAQKLKQEKQLDSDLQFSRQEQPPSTPPVMPPVTPPAAPQTPQA